MLVRALVVTTLAGLVATPLARPISAQDRHLPPGRIVDLRGPGPSRSAPGVRLWLESDRPTSAPVRVYVRPERDAYVAVVRVDAAGRATILFPRSPDDDAYLQGDVTYRVRDARAGGISSQGRAYVFAIASDDPFDFTNFERSGEWRASYVGDAAAALDPESGVRQFADQVLFDEHSRYAYDVEELGGERVAVVASNGCDVSCEGGSAYAEDIVYGGASALYLNRVAFSCFGSTFGWSIGYSPWPFLDACNTYRRLRPLHIRALPGFDGGHRRPYAPHGRPPRPPRAYFDPIDPRNAPTHIRTLPDHGTDRGRDRGSDHGRDHGRDRGHSTARDRSSAATRGGGSWVEARPTHERPGMVLRGGDYTAERTGERSMTEHATSSPATGSGTLPQVFRGSPSATPGAGMRMGTAASPMGARSVAPVAGARTWGTGRPDPRAGARTAPSSPSAGARTAPTIVMPRARSRP